MHRVTSDRLVEAVAEEMAITEVGNTSHLRKVAGLVPKFCVEFSQLFMGWNAKPKFLRDGVSRFSLLHH